MMCASSDISTLAVRKSMLVVDPQRRVDRLLNRLVSQEGWNLLEAPNNETVLSFIKNSSFDLVITGQRTSGREDLELLRKIRGVRSHTRMIILTDHKTPADVIAALQQDVFSFFGTPFSGEYFLHMVRLAMIEPHWDDGIEVIAATPTWIRLLARCTIDTASRLVQFLRQSSLPDPEKEDVACAAHEILLNAMEHGAKFDPNQYVEIGYLRTKRELACRVKDPGKGFTLEELRHAALNSPPGDLFAHMTVREEQGLRNGGFGILMATKLVDEVIYGERGNDVILVKYLDASSAGVNVGSRPLDA
jgi:anti-sigma regulatory factor (Ser/Thr protein kinase)/ActR/RegA family two-component response regulator